MRVILLIMVCLAAIGCRSDSRCSRETALLRAEILDLEDKYYLLKSNHEVVVSELNGLKGISGDIIYEDPIIYETELPSTSTNAAGNQFQNVGMPVQSGSRQVYLDQPTVIQNSGRPIRNLEDFHLNSSDVRSRPARVIQSAAGVTAAATDGVSSQVALNPTRPEIPYDIDSVGNVNITEVLIDRSVTRGHDVDGKPGDEGIELLIQPRTADESVVLQSGELTVSLIDPAESPDRQRIGLWKFLPGETELFFANDPSGNRGILLHLPWGQRPPANQRLIIHVRFISHGGQTLKTSSELRIVPPSENYSAEDPQVSQWTKRDPRWISEQNQQPTDSTPAKTATQKPSWRPIR